MIVQVLIEVLIEVLSQTVRAYFHGCLRMFDAHSIVPAGTAQSNGSTRSVAPRQYLVQQIIQGHVDVLSPLRCS